MDTTIQKKLKAYSVTAGAITAAVAAQGQITHTDLIPDVVLDSGASYVLDFNADALPEASLEASFYTDSTSGDQYGFSRMTLYPTAANATLGNLFYNVIPLPFSLNAGDSIRPAATDWKDTSANQGLQYFAYVFPSPGPAYGNWPGVSDKYMGFRFAIGAQTHYGWVRLSCAASGDVLTIKEYAYNTTPGAGIVAGQTSLVGVAEQTAGIPKIHVYDHTLFVNLPAGTPTGGMLQIYNTAGQLVHTESITDPAMRIALGDLATGVYMVQIIQPDGTTVTRKIYL